MQTVLSENLILNRIQMGTDMSCDDNWHTTPVNDN